MGYGMGTREDREQVKRIRGRRGVALRRRLLAEEPLCRACAARGRVAAAVELDHIVPLSKGGTNAAGNLQPLCGDCHAAKTAADLGHQAKPQVGVDGWPVAPA
jgi:5-methylcytosine-specific restriction protein A